MLASEVPPPRDVSWLINLTFVPSRVLAGPSVTGRCRFKRPFNGRQRNGIESVCDLKVLQAFVIESQISKSANGVIQEFRSLNSVDSYAGLQWQPLTLTKHMFMRRVLRDRGRSHARGGTGLSDRATGSCSVRSGARCCRLLRHVRQPRVNVPFIRKGTVRPLNTPALRLVPERFDR